MKRGDIYLVSLDPTEVREQRGSRPLVIVSPDEFNQATKLPEVLPITTAASSHAD
jgi:mRNA interferase ChpB